MPDPITKAPEIRQKLAEYLTQETTQFYPDIDWLYYQIEHDSTMSPRGAIFLDEEISDRNYPMNLATNQTCYKIHIKLTISKDTLLELLDAIDNWAAQIKNETLKKLQCDGYEGLFKGIHLNPQRSIVKEYNKNQDTGGTGCVHFFLLWEDQGAIAGVGGGAGFF
ncbi:hypothetical protein Xen7305DRAFT_00008710 [Xenococcus sp. PCC 7305]|uniref:hypothetical protein n=1 Tax=Xenococcus sp. PCC 7305 TaxID=102125 RepID=UPI0002AD0C47|nr:hypothetical protein [Xenococcus sp. PCC 7305]ELS01169.1 hypothetical protein Xen7305DRAFT_00008710 [Xenococcus sp. PCC 7305]